jgi:L-lactate utilization protein LutB
MKIFIFEYIHQLTDNYHGGGGLVIIAKDKEHAEELIKDDRSLKISQKEWEVVKSYELKDDKVKPEYWVMPDAGCC